MRTIKKILILIFINIFLFSLTTYTETIDPNIDGGGTHEEGHGAQAKGYGWLYNMDGIRVSVYETDSKNLVAKCDFSKYPKTYFENMRTMGEGLNKFEWISVYNAGIMEMRYALEPTEVGEYNYRFQDDLPDFLKRETLSDSERVSAIRNYFTNADNVYRIFQGLYIETGEVIDVEKWKKGKVAVYIEPIGYYQIQWGDSEPVSMQVALTSAEAGAIGYANMPECITSKGEQLAGKLTFTAYHSLPMSLYFEHTDSTFGLGSITEQGGNPNHYCGDMSAYRLMITCYGISEITAIEVPPVIAEDETKEIYRTLPCDLDVVLGVDFFDARGEGFPQQNPLQGTEDEQGNKWKGYVNRVNDSGLAKVDWYIEGIKTKTQALAIPEGGSQRYWVKFHTPPYPEIIEVKAVMSGGMGCEDTSDIRGNTAYIYIEIVDISEDIEEPPDPKATDRNDGFYNRSSPYNEEDNDFRKTWTTYKYKWVPEYHYKCKKCGNWYAQGEPLDDACYTTYTAKGNPVDHPCKIGTGDKYNQDWGHVEYIPEEHEVVYKITGDIQADTHMPTDVFKSGYGITSSIKCSATFKNATSDDITPPQICWAIFPEFDYNEDIGRMMKRTGGSSSSSFVFDENEYSQYDTKVHFTPVWFPDGTYDVMFWLAYVFTPYNEEAFYTSKQIEIDGSVFDDWHIAPNTR